MSELAQTHRERTICGASGWSILPIALAGFPGGILLGIIGIAALRSPVIFVVGLLITLLGVFLWKGFFTLQPNEATVLTLFGAYKGTVRESGFFFTNPFYRRQRISLRVRNFQSEKLKVNDKRGNPIEIAAVVVWRVADTGQATFDVEDYQDFVEVQSETAVRHLANEFAYDQGDDDEVTLLNGGSQVSQVLTKELQSGLEQAGVAVDQARVTHLAYAPEIAGAMLRRQQAEAVIAARQKIVTGAVSMVEMALSELEHKKVLQLDDERKAAMVSNLLVVLCGDHDATPVVNTGTLYN